MNAQGMLGTCNQFLFMSEMESSEACTLDWLVCKSQATIHIRGKKRADVEKIEYTILVVVDLKISSEECFEEQ